MLNPDFRDMLAEFNAGGVEYLVVGGYAVAHHSYPRATGDMDFWIRRSPENAERVLRALAAFGVPNGLVTRDDLLDREVVAQIGVEPNRIDILTVIDGIEFDDAYPDRVIAKIGDVEIPFVGLHHLLENKRAAHDDAALARIFGQIADRWMLTTDERRNLLGGIARSTHGKWTHENPLRTLTFDQRERIAHIIGIDVATQAFYGVNSENAVTHVRRPHTAPNGGGTALAVMLTGLAGLADVRRHIEALAGRNIVT